jgi:hypothetical protein
MTVLGDTRLLAHLTGKATFTCVVWLLGMSSCRQQKQQIHESVLLRPERLHGMYDWTCLNHDALADGAELNGGEVG